MTITTEERALVRKCMETIKAMRKMGLDRGGGTTATEDNLSRVVPKLLDALEAAERERDELRIAADAQSAKRAELQRERDALQGIVDDIASETGHCLLLDDEEHEAPTLPDWVRGIVRDRDAAIAKCEQLAAERPISVDMYDHVSAELEACKAKLAALASYRIDHRLDCEFDPPNAKACTCGLDDLLAAAKEPTP